MRYSSSFCHDSPPKRWAGLPGPGRGNAGTREVTISLPLNNNSKEGPLELMCLTDLFRSEYNPLLPPPAKSPGLSVAFRCGRSVWGQGRMKGKVNRGDQSLLILVL